MHGRDLPDRFGRRRSCFDRGLHGSDISADNDGSVSSARLTRAGVAHCFSHVFGGDVEPDKRAVVRRFLSDHSYLINRDCSPAYSLIETEVDHDRTADAVFAIREDRIPPRLLRRTISTAKRTVTRGGNKRPLTRETRLENPARLQRVWQRLVPRSQLLTYIRLPDAA
jgi:hypothetical protein